MNTLRGWLLRMGEFFGRERRERELAAEMESHLQMHIDENLRAGMTAGEARRKALIKLGGIEQTKEMVRERRGLPMLEVLLQDLRFGVRLRRAHAVEKSRFHGCGHANACAGNCRERHDFQFCERRHV